MEQRRTTGITYVRYNPDKPRGTIPSRYFSCSDWPADIASIALTWTEKPDGTYRIDHGITEAFIMQDCKDVALPASIDGVAVTEVAACAFEIVLLYIMHKDETATHPYCTSLTIPNGMKTLGKCSISGFNPEMVYIPESLEHIVNLGFYASHTDHLTLKREFSVDKNNQQYCSLEGSLYTKDMRKLIYHKKPYAESIRIPDTVVDIGVDAFLYGSRLPKVIEAPGTMAGINVTPNSNCLWVCPKDSPTYEAAQRKGYYAVTERYGIHNGYVYDVLDEKTSVLIKYEGEKTNLSIPRAFEGLPLVTVGANAFPSEITSIDFPDTVETMAGRCRGVELKRVKLSKNLRSIGPDTFRDARLEKPLTIPKSCTHIGENSFYQSTLLFEGLDARVLVNSAAALECFREGFPPFDFPKYDEAVTNMVDGKPKMLALLARITHPYMLSDSYRESYVKYLRVSRSDLVAYIVETDNLGVLTKLLQEEFFTEQDVEYCVKFFTDKHYTQGVIQLTDYRHTHFSRDTASRFTL